MPDFKSLHYITSPNMVLRNGENHYQGIDNKGPFIKCHTSFQSRNKKATVNTYWGAVITKDKTTPRPT